MTGSDQETFRERVEEVVASFLAVEAELLINNASEQAMTHRLAVLLENEFPEWNVDCEYNRDQEAVKRLKYAISSEYSVDEKDVVPDIIVHKRMTDNNLLVIEVKKSTNTEPDEKDLSKLRAFREQLGYQNAVFIRFMAGTDTPCIQDIQWI